MRERGLSAAWRSDIRHKFSLAFVAGFAVFPLGRAIAQVGESVLALVVDLVVGAIGGRS